MTIWVDADACPAVIRDILIRAARRTRVALVFVTNSYLPLPADDNIRLQQVGSGYDVADNEIVRQAEPGDLVVTSDLPLANDVLEKGARVVSHRGDAMTLNTIKARLNMRDFMETMRASGVHTGGPPALSAADRKAFAQVLDSYLHSTRR